MRRLSLIWPLIALAIISILLGGNMLVIASSLILVYLVTRDLQA